MQNTTTSTAEENDYQRELPGMVNPVFSASSVEEHSVTYSAQAGAAAISGHEKKKEILDDDGLDLENPPPPPYTERDEAGHVSGLGLPAYSSNRSLGIINHANIDIALDTPTRAATENDYDTIPCRAPVPASTAQEVTASGEGNVSASNPLYDQLVTRPKRVVNLENPTYASLNGNTSAEPISMVHGTGQTDDDVSEAAQTSGSPDYAELPEPRPLARD